MNEEKTMLIGGSIAGRHIPVSEVDDCWTKDEEEASHCGWFESIDGKGKCTANDRRRPLCENRHRATEEERGHEDLLGACEGLLSYVREKYGVKDNDFSCPHMCSIAEAINRIEGKNK